MRNLVTIKKFNLIGSDDRGMTADFTIARQQDEFIFLTRKSGSISGNTYHEGKNTGTNPKIFLFLSGSIKLSYRQIGDTVIDTIMVEAPCIIEVKPMVTIKVEAIADIMMLECNSIADIESDRKRENV